MFLSGTLKNNEKEEEMSRMNELLKKTLTEKNKQIEDLTKKNRLLSYQIDEGKPKRK